MMETVKVTESENNVWNERVFQMSDVTLSANQSAAIDALVAKAKAAAEARKLAKAAAEEELVNEDSDDDTDEAPVKVEKKSKEKKAKKETKVVAKKGVKPEVDQAAIDAAKANAKIERQGIKAVRDRERAEKKAAAAEAKAAKKAAKVAVVKAPAHMKKVDKAYANLPKMNADVDNVFDLVCEAGLTEGQMAILCAHLAHHNRVRATLRSADMNLEEGMTVEIVSSDRDPRLIGKRGVIAQVRKIRVLVDVPGMANQAYLFCADVAPVPEEETEETVDEVEVPETVVTDEEVAEEGEETLPTTEETEESLPEFITGTDAE